MSYLIYSSEILEVYLTFRRAQQFLVKASMMSDNPSAVGILPQLADQTPIMGQREEEQHRDITSFAYYFPDAHPSWFVKYLGGGHEGDAVLVVSHVDGKLYVRKRKSLAQYSQSKASCTAATTNYIEHKHIPRLISSTSLLRELRKHRLTQGRTINGNVTAELWQYCNGGDLHNVLVKCTRLPRALCPEVLIWCLMRAFISVLPYIHVRGVCHADILPVNVLLDWPGPGDDDDGTDGLPVFYLADFGLSFRLPPDRETIMRRGLPNIMAAVRFDFEFAARTIAYAMNSIGGLPGKHYAETTKLHDCARLYYSAGLLRAFDQFCQMPLLLNPNGPSETDVEAWYRLFDELPHEIRAGQLESTKLLSADDRAMLEMLRPNQDELNAADPRFILPIDMAGCAQQPPGPWCKVFLYDNGDTVVPVNLDNKHCVGNAKMSFA
jgi:hypothetical protein